jgi:hypothetical protein
MGIENTARFIRAIHLRQNWRNVHRALALHYVVTIYKRVVQRIEMTFQYPGNDEFLNY